MLTSISFIYFILNYFLFTYLLQKIIFSIYLFIKLLNIYESPSTWVGSMKEVWTTCFLQIFTYLIKRLMFLFSIKKWSRFFVNSSINYTKQHSKIPYTFSQ